MTGRERSLNVFEGKLPDRVPVTLFIVDQGHFITQMYPGVEKIEIINIDQNV